MQKIWEGRGGNLQTESRWRQVSKVDQSDKHRRATHILKAGSEARSE